MTTMEKLFAQIFERKDWIIEEVQRQANAYTEQLVSRLLIDGITPPPSLLNQRFNSRSLDPHELKKEEIISKLLLLQHPRESVRYSTGGHSLYDKPVVGGGNGQLSKEICMETHAPNTGLNVTNEPSNAPALPNSEIGCSLNCVTEQDNNVNSPHNETTDARVSSIYVAPDSSLARIQRSRSRQKARELRNSAKTAAKSCLSKEDRTRISFTEDTIQGTPQDNKCPSEPDKCNNHSKTDDKEELDGGIPTGKSSRQSGHADGVMEGVISFASYEAEKSVSGKTHDAQRQSKPYSGRITRSKASSQQSSRINKSLKLGTSASTNPKEGRGALSYSIDDLKLGADASNKLLVDAVKTSGTQAVCSSKKEVVISSNIAAASMKECPIDQENAAEIVVESGPIDVPVVAVEDSGKKLDPVVTMCMESDGSADLKQSSECCMVVKPKQLNFDEPDGCDSNKTSRKRKLDELLEHDSNPSTFEQQLPMGNQVSSQSKSARRTHSHDDFEECTTNVDTMNMNENHPMVEDGLLSEKRKADGLLGQECNPSMDSSDSSMDHKSSGTFFEQQQLPMEKNVSSSQSKAAKTHPHDEFDELCAKDEMMNMNGKSVVVEEEEDVEHNDGAAILCEVDEGEECAFIPVSKDPKQPWFTASCLTTKQGETEVRPPDQDLGMKELEDGTSSKLSSFKPSSDKVNNNTWPRDPQRIVEGQRNCFSGSHIQRKDAVIHCDLDTSENDLYLSKSDDIRSPDHKSVHDEMTCHLPDRTTESLHELLQAAEETVAEVDDTTLLNQSESKVSNLNKSEAADYGDVAVTDIEMMPVYEGFTIDGEVEAGIDFGKLKMPSTTIERASILEQICKSYTPFSQFSSTFNQHQVQDLYKSMPGGLVEDVDMGNSEDFSKQISESDCDLTEADYTFSKQKTFDSVQFSGTPYYRQSKNYYSSPVGKFWDRSASSSGSSDNRLSSNPELTCFPIEEDPDSNEESEYDQFQENTTTKAATNEDKVPITEIETVTPENDDEVAVGIVPKVANQLPEREPPSGPMRYRERCSSNSVNVQVNVPKTNDNVKYKSKFHPGFKSSNYAEENRTPSVSTRTSIRRNASLQTQNSKTMRSGIKRPSQKEAKRNNIVSNITSFVSILQQKQAAAVAPVKRDIKVKALEAAEAAKRREQEKENERKMKKEALKIERARVEKENAREVELNRKKKQEEMKKKEADVAARKKQREEDERKQVAKKRKIAEARKEQQKVHQHERPRGGKNLAVAGLKKVSEKVGDDVRQNKNVDERNEKSLADHVIQQVTCVAEKDTNVLEKSPGQVGSMRQETSYDISPYQCSDDEEEEEDDLPTKKFVPSWASKKAVAMVLPLQHELDPETIFPVGSFCRMDEVLLPRRLQAQ